MMIKSSGIAPESLPIETDINKVKRQLKGAAKKMEKLDTPKKTPRIKK